MLILLTSLKRLTMSYQDLYPKEFKQQFDATSDAVLIDVRTSAEIEDASIEGHIAIDIQKPDFIEKVAQLDKDKSYFIYCRSGNRSGQACRYMASQGFTKLFNMKGGILEWLETDFD